ncbi:hypothetical protein PTKIN_Ptkin10aG0053400 [Pterospermum kingtungense]
MMNKVSIDDEDEFDDEIYIDNQWVEENKGVSDRCLIGKMILRKPFSLDAMKTTFHKCHSQPLGFMIEKVGIIIGEKLGEVDEVINLKIQYKPVIKNFDFSLQADGITLPDSRGALISQTSASRSSPSCQSIDDNVTRIRSKAICMGSLHHVEKDKRLKDNDLGVIAKDQSKMLADNIETEEHDKGKTVDSEAYYFEKLKVLDAEGISTEVSAKRLLLAARKGDRFIDILMASDFGRPFSIGYGGSSKTLTQHKWKRKKGPNQLEVSDGSKSSALVQRKRSSSILEDSGFSKKPKDVDQRDATDQTAVGNKLCAGGFNELLSSEEELGGSLRLYKQMLDFGKAISDCNLLDIPFMGPMFTWYRGQGNNMVMERLDKGFATKA